MRHRIQYSLPAKLVDHDGVQLQIKELLANLDGYACVDDNVLNYAELAFADECDLRRGFPRLLLDEKGRLAMAVEVDSKRELTTAELKKLKADFEGQLTDGIGAGCFDAISSKTGVSIELILPLKAKCTQQEGQAWKPTQATAKSNQRRIVAIQKLLDQADQKDETKKSKAKPNNQQPSTTGKKAQPNFAKLLRMLDKVDREFKFDEIQAQVEAIGGDLSQLPSGTFPSGNFQSPKFLKMLLAAGLPPEAVDTKGHTLLYQAAGSPECLAELLKLKCKVDDTGTYILKETPLMRAAFLGKLKCVQLLLDAGANAKAKDLSGDTALDNVNERSRDRAAIEKLLKAKMAKR